MAVLHQSEQVDLPPRVERYRLHERYVSEDEEGGGGEYWKQGGRFYGMRDGCCDGGIVGFERVWMG